MKRWLILLLLIICIFVALVLYAPSKRASLILQAIGVFISSIIAISAIWGELIRDSFAGPKLKVSLFSPEGELTHFPDGKDIRYYHLSVINKRKGTIARNTRVNVVSIRRKVSGVWQQRQSIYGLQLPWVFSDSYALNIGPKAKCDLMSIVEQSDFRLAYYLCPNNVNLFFTAGQLVGIEVVAVADNATSKTLSLDFIWDGQWSKDDHEMREHLKIKNV
jgi:hypothetical protein